MVRFFPITIEFPIIPILGFKVGAHYDDERNWSNNYWLTNF